MDRILTALYTPNSAAAELAAAQAAQIAALSAGCAATITGGYTSSALGTIHTYPNQMADQLNMAASVIASLLPNLPTTWTTPFTCADVNGIWAKMPHTAAQIQQAGSDGKAFVLAQQAQLEALKTQVNAATSIAAVQAIKWKAA